MITSKLADSGSWVGKLFTIYEKWWNFNPSRFNPGRREKIKINFYFHTSLWSLKRFYEGLWGTTKKCEDKNLT